MAGDASSSAVCVLFSGQSVQRQGMGRRLWEIPEARDVLRRLEPSLGSDLEELTTSASDETLSRTSNAQRAIHAHHLGHWLALGARRPDLRLSGAAGHSVGIVAALVAAGSISVEDSGVFVAERARAFSEACARLAEPHGLAAVATDDLADVEDELARFPGVTLALENSKGKGVLGGRLEALEEFARVCRAEGWPVRVTPLAVEGPYHTEAFASCGPRLERVLEKIEVRAPQVPVFMGTSGQAEIEPDRIRELLAKQPYTRERHLSAIRAAYDHGCRAFLEASSAPQPVHWIADQLSDDQGAPLPGVETITITTEEL